MTKITALTIMNLVRSKAGGKLELFVQQTHLRGLFVEQMLMLSSSFRCDQIYKLWINDFGHTLL